MSLILSGTDGLSDVDGSASTPAIRGTDTNTGIFFPAADTIAFSEGGAEAMRITSAGEVLIGTTTSNGFKFKVSDGGAAEFAFLPNDSGVSSLVSYNRSTSAYFPFQINSLDTRFLTSGTERMRIDSSGRVTKAYQPSFHVRINTAVYTTSTPLPFTNVVFDVGSNFNTSTYRFTAPIAGKYLFILSVYGRIDNNEDFYPFLRVNGSNTQYSAFYNNGTGGQIHNTSVVTAIFNLSANDYVDSIYTGSGDYYGGNQETNLFGYLLG